MLIRRVATFVFASIIALAACIPGQGSQAPDGTVPAPEICDTADVLGILQQPVLYNTAAGRHALYVMLTQRLNACHEKLRNTVDVSATAPPAPYWDKIIGTPTAPPIAVPSECTSAAHSEPHYTPVAIYAVLSRCVALVKILAQSPPTPPPYTMTQNTFYVFTSGTIDPTTASLAVREVVSRLETAERNERSVRHPLWLGRRLPIVIGRPDWTTDASFTTQCQLDPNTIGALFIKSATPQTRSLNYILWNDQGTLVKASVELRDCADDDHNSSSSPSVVWNSKQDDEPKGLAHQGGISLGLVAGAAGLFAKKTTTTTTSSSVVLAPAPAPVATVQSMTTTDAIDTPLILGTAASAFAGQVFPAQNQSTQTQLAAERFAEDLMTRLNARCNKQQLFTDAQSVDPIITASNPNDDRYDPNFKYTWEIAKYCDYFYDFDSMPSGGNRAHHEALIDKLANQRAVNADFLPTPAPKPKVKAKPGA